MLALRSISFKNNIDHSIVKARFSQIPVYTSIYF